MLLALKPEVTYGPVSSRRLGRSLGINLFPGGRKVCTFDCAYCQYGWGASVSRIGQLPEAVPSPEEVLEGVEDRLLSLPEPPDFVTFSGNGEPTLHPCFPEIVEGVLSLRDRLAPHARAAILSNSSTVAQPAIRSALARLDVRIMKLDAGNEETFRRFNRPSPGQTLEALLEGLRQLREVTIQSLFAGGPGGNLDEAHVRDWVGAVTSLKPLSVQVYTLDREAPSRRLAKACRESLERIGETLASRGVRATVVPPRDGR